jgi:serine/threonine-protein kinase
MELLSGESLAQRLLREELLSVEDTANIMLQAVSAVGAAHERGIVHRDLKPDNVFLCDGEDVPRVKILDFGVAKLASPGEHASGLTSMGQVLGTPAYMAPEQCRGERDVDHRADMWAIGVMLYEMLSGERPLEGTTVGEIVECLLTEGVPPLRELAPEAPFDLAVAARRLLERKVKNRGEDLRDVFEVLKSYASIDAPVFGPAQVQPSLGDHVPRSSKRLTVSEALQPTENGTLEPAQTSIPMTGGSSWRYGIAAVLVLAAVVGWRALSQDAGTSSQSVVDSAVPIIDVEVAQKAPLRPSAAPEPAAEPPKATATASVATSVVPIAKPPKPAPAPPTAPTAAPSATTATISTTTSSERGPRVQQWE